MLIIFDDRINVVMVQVNPQFNPFLLDPQPTVNTLNVFDHLRDSDRTLHFASNGN